MELSLHSNDQKKNKKKQLRLSFYMQSGLKKAKMVKSDEKIMTMIFFSFRRGDIHRITYIDTYKKGYNEWNEFIGLDTQKKKPTFTKEYQNNTQVQFHWSN